MSSPEPSRKSPLQHPGLFTLVRLFPVVFGMIGVSVVLLPWSLQGGPWTSVVLRTTAIIDPLELPGLVAGGGLAGVRAALSEVIQRGEVWRLITPMFLHFNFVHITFNAAIVYLLGQRLELRLGTLWMLLFVLVSAAVSNVVQLYWSQQSYFGGLSGVGLALLGGLIALGWLRPSDPEFRLPKTFIASTLVFVVVFSTGITERVGLHVANAAHWGGLGTGLVLGLLMHGVLPRVQT